MFYICSDSVEALAAQPGATPKTIQTEIKMTDATLRDELASSGGANMVGTTTGNTVQNRLDAVPAQAKTSIESALVALDDATDEYTLGQIINRIGLTPQMMPGFTVGALNHSPYINAAIDRVITGGGGAVLLPPLSGDWKIGAALALHKSGYSTSYVNLRGVGDKARLRWLNTTGDMILIGDGNNPVYYVTLENLYLYAGGGARTSGIDIKAVKANIVHIRNIITDGSYAGFYGEDLNSVYHQMVQYIMPNQTHGAGVTIYSNPSGSGRTDIVKFDEVTVQAHNAGSDGMIVSGRVAGVHTDGFYALGTRRGLQLVSASSTFSDIPQFCDFRKFEVDRALDIGVAIEKAYRTEFSRCDISNTSGALDSPYPQGSADHQALFINSGAIDTKIIGGRIGNCRDQAIYDLGRGTTIIGTSVTDMAKNTGGSFAAIYTGPSANGFYYDGLLVDGYSRAKWVTQIDPAAANGIIRNIRYQNIVTAYANGTGTNATNSGQVQTNYGY